MIRRSNNQLPIGFMPTVAWFAVLLLAELPFAEAQVITLPTMGNFSVQTSVLAPDSGAASLGSNRRSSYGSTSRGAGPLANRSAGGSVQLPSASVAVGIIDLEFLDQAILAAAESKDGIRSIENGKEDLSQQGDSYSGTRSNSQLPSSKAISNMRHASTPHREIQSRSADYDYMALLNHPDDPTIVRDYAGDIRFFLQQAKHARDGSHWASVQVFYEQAWTRLPLHQRRQVIETLKKHQESRTKQNKSTAKP